MLRVLGRASSINVRKVLWTCAEIGLPVRREDWGAGHRPTAEPEFTALNPHRLVPVVVAPGRDGARDFVLWESNTICRWLAAEHGRADLLPAGPRDRAGVERWMDWQATELNSAWRGAFLGLVRRNPDFADPAAIAASAAAWNRQMAVLDAWLHEHGPHAAGADFTLADVVLGLSVQRWLATPIVHAPLPALRAYHARLAARPAWAAAGCADHP
jgi:glutathione S-transferase